MSLPELTPDRITLLQKQDPFCNNILAHLHCNTHDKYFTDSMEILHKKVMNFNKKKLYYFLNMRKTKHKYVRTCSKWQIMNLQRPHYTHLHQEIAQTPCSLINQPHWTLQHNHIWLHICYHSNLQSHQLSNDNSHPQ